MNISNEFRKEFIAKASKEILIKLKEKASKEGKRLSFDDIETAVLMFRQQIGEDITNTIMKEEGTGKLSEKKSV